MPGLTLIVGGAGSGKTDEVVSRLAARYEADPFSETVVLVPTVRHGDQFRRRLVGRCGVALRLRVETIDRAQPGAGAGRAATLPHAGPRAAHADGAARDRTRTGRLFRTHRGHDRVRGPPGRRRRRSPLGGDGPSSPCLKPRRSLAPPASSRSAPSLRPTSPSSNAEGGCTPLRSRWPRPAPYGPAARRRPSSCSTASRSSGGASSYCWRLSPARRRSSRRWTPTREPELATTTISSAGGSPTRKSCS